jgi:hypothetical protein
MKHYKCTSKNECIYYQQGFCTSNKECEFQSSESLLFNNESEIKIKVNYNSSNPSDNCYNIFINNKWMATRTTPELTLRYLAELLNVKVEDDTHHPLFRIWYRSLTKEEILNDKASKNKPKKTKEKRKIIW